MVSEKMLALGQTRSCIRDLFEYGLKRAAEVGAENVFDYSLGNPSIPAPDGVNRAIIDTVENESSLAVHGYTSAAGYDGVRRAVADDLTSRFGMETRAENLFFTCGAAPALCSVLRALATENSEVIAIAPFFPEYRPFVECSGSKFVVVPPDMGSFQINFDALFTLVNERTQAIMINSPNNPSGVVYTQETLQKLGAFLEKKSAEFGHPIYLISDEPYRELVYGGVTVPFIPSIYKNTIICYSYSKSLSLPGERIGYVCIPDCVEDSKLVFAAVAGAARVEGHVCPPSLLQRVIAKCADLRPDLEAYDRNRRLLLDSLTEYGYKVAKPDGAFYLFIEAPGGSSREFSERAKAKNLLVVPGDDFGCPEYFRICYCIDYDKIKRSLPIFKELIEER